MKTKDFALVLKTSHSALASIFELSSTEATQTTRALLHESRYVALQLVFGGLSLWNGFQHGLQNMIMFMMIMMMMMMMVGAALLMLICDLY